MGNWTISYHRFPVFKAHVLSIKLVWCHSPPSLRTTTPFGRTSKWVSPSPLYKAALHSSIIECNGLPIQMSFKFQGCNFISSQTKGHSIVSAINLEWILILELHHHLIITKLKGCLCTFSRCYLWFLLLYIHEDGVYGHLLSILCFWIALTIYVSCNVLQDSRSAIM